MAKPSVAIIDYEMSNLFSVKRACENAGFRASLTADGSRIMKSQGAILPGVGAFGEAMKNLKRLDLVAPIKEFVASGKPLMGVCLGMQLLMTESEEFGTRRGLNIIEGAVVRFPTISKEGKVVKVPQVGWNRVFRPSFAAENYWENTPLNGIANGEFMYFVHSYYAVPSSTEDILTVSTYGGAEYASSIRKKNIVAFQFHPEKSDRKGIEIYHNFRAIIEREAS
jgi:imidazole glycerol-phosphate synthase subunit HisH